MSIYYQDETVTLHLGDCLEIDAWLAADVLVTDPPYGRDWRQGELKGHFSSNALRGIANDQTTGVRDAALGVWGTVRPAVVFGDLMLSPPKSTKLVCVYQKPSNAGLRGAMAGVRRDAEAIYLLNAWPSGLGGRSSIFTTNAPIIGGANGFGARAGGHPHTKPLDLMQQLVMLAPGTITDPFAGSGSTLVAAKLQGRKAIGVELEERYCEIAANRLAQGVMEFPA